MMLIAAALAVASALPAAAQEDDDLDSLPMPTSHHVVRPSGKASPETPLPAPAPAAPPSAPKSDDVSTEKPAPSVKRVRHRHEPKKRRRHAKRERHHRRKAAPPAPPPPSPEEAIPEPPRHVVQGAAGAEAGEEAPATLPVGSGEARRPEAAQSGMDFDLLPQSQPTASAATDVEKRIKRRRTMLQVHQGFGIATAALMAGTVITGQLNYSDRFGGGGSSGRFELLHDGLEAATTVSFATAGLLALLAPVPFDREKEGVDTVTVHKWSMLVATIGMASEIPLGIYTVSREGYVNQGTMALTHLVVGYVTAAALATGATALFF